MSYPQYSRYEAGEQLPSLPQALAIGEALSIPPLEMTLEWNLAQLSGHSISAASEQIRSLLATIRSGGAPAPATKSLPVALDEVIVFNRSHRDLFMKDPAYRDIFTYINAFGAGETTAEGISRALGIPMKKLEGMLGNLLDLGVILKKGRLLKAAKSNFYFPDDADFFELRQQNIRHNLEQVLDRMSLAELQEKKAVRGLVTRELTVAQLGWVTAQIEGLLGRIIELPEDPAAGTIYSVCAVVGERFSR